MIEFIVDILIELGLIHVDHKHQKRVTTKEKEDGVKRPLQKYFLQPSIVILFSVLLIFSIGAILFLTFRRTSILQERTEKEISEISQRLEKWKDKYGSYPCNLNELIGNNPMRQNWKVDYWNQDYKFNLTKGNNGFSLISSGSDKKFDTDDDIIRQDKKTNKP